MSLVLGSGIGRETGFVFAERGASAVIFADINEKFAQDVAQSSTKLAIQSAYRTSAKKVDTTDQESVQRLVNAVVNEFGRIDSFPNSAGVSY